MFRTFGVKPRVRLWGGAIAPERPTKNVYVFREVSRERMFRTFGVKPRVRLWGGADSG